MKTAYYRFGIFFLGLSVVCGVLESIMQFQVGHHIYYLQSFAHWFLTVNAISIIGTLFVLKYLRIKQYWLAFWVGTVATVFLVAQVVLNYVALILVRRELQWFSVLLTLFLGLSIFFALSLVFSKAREKFWMKVAGVFMLILYTVFGSAFVWGLLTPTFLATETFAQIEQWTSLVGNFVPVFFMMNFDRELRSIAVAEATVIEKSSSEMVLGVLAVTAFVSALILGLLVGQESYWNMHWQRKGPESSLELAKSFETRAYVSHRGDTLHYLIKRPLGYDAEKKYPLVVCLHGGIKRTREVEVPQPAPFLSEPENQRKYPAFIFVPQGPPGHSWGGMPGLPSDDSLVFEAMASLEEEFPIDEKRRYVAGGSMGGYGAWHFIGTRPEMFAATIPFCGAGNIELAKNMVDIPVWAFHGRDDRNVPVSASREMIEAIKKAGGNPRYTEFLHTGHNVWPDISKTPGLLDWLFAQKRK